ncbi:translocase of inner membrane 9b [Arctopsyche grandis]|uniref:translocase of inner membrane 9b n=1 Tax=Arctopsyche grandis TaxID=121162 RepID=UPI00406D7EE5
MDYASFRNFKDFMLLYNVTTEACFSRCVDNFNSRKLADEELKCAEVCAGKYINYLNKVMSSYIVAQQDIVMKRIAESQSDAQSVPSSTDPNPPPT